MRPVAGEYYSIKKEARSGIYLDEYNDMLKKGSDRFGKEDFVSEQRLEECMEQARRLALEAATAIRAARFPRQPLNDDCRWCGYESICRNKESVPGGLREAED